MGEIRNDYVAGYPCSCTSLAAGIVYLQGFSRTRHKYIARERTMDSDKIRQSLERLGRTLSAGDLRGVSSCWEIPAVFLSDDGATILADASQLEKLFAQATEWYRSRGLISTKPELERVDILSEKLAAVDVRWPAFDASGQEKSSERSYYIVRLGSDGQVRIRIALTRTK